MKVRNLLACMCWLCCWNAHTPADAGDKTDLGDKAPLVAVESPQGVTILEGIRPVLTYQRATVSQGGKWPRANYVHPLYDLDGEVISQDFPADHGHHRGIFWAWHQVLVGDQSLGDAWACLDFQWDVQELNVSTTADQAQLVATTLWKSPGLLGADGQPLPCVREQTTIVVHSSEENVRWIDFDIQLWALLDQVRIGGSDDAKGYGGFSPRIKLSDDLQFRGSGGLIEPQVEAVAAGAWVDISNDHGGVLIMTHSQNPGFPQPWILRRSSSMQNAVFPGRQPIELSRTEPLRLRYRLGIHRGELPSEKIEAVQERY